MTDDSYPSNALIQVLDDADRRRVAFPGLFDARQPYTLQLESEEDFKDVDSILWGLGFDKNLLTRFPALNTWETNPLFGIDPTNINLLWRAHRFGNPRWLREEIDVRMLLSSVVAENGPPLGPLVVLGLPNFASHLGLLGCLVGAKWHSAIIARPDDSVEVVFSAKKSDGAFEKLFISRIEMAGHSSARQLGELRAAARNRTRVPIMLPITPETFDEMLSPSRLPALNVPLTSVGFIVSAVVSENEWGASPLANIGDASEPCPVEGRIGSLVQAA